jgi:hypothetical protein
LEVVVTTAIDIFVSDCGIRYHVPGTISYYLGFPWHLTDDIARMDGISPPTGEELGKLLNSMYDLSEPKDFQIIRW